MTADPVEIVARALRHSPDDACADLTWDEVAAEFPAVVDLYRDRARALIARIAPLLDGGRPHPAPLAPPEPQEGT